MKKILFVIGLLVTMLSSNGQFSHEPFNYTPDPVLGIYTQSSTAWVRINTGDSILVTSGNLTYTGLPSSSGNKIAFDGTGSDNYRVFGTAVTTGSVYFSFILNVSALGGLTTTGGYFSGLLQAASTSSFGGTIWTRLSTTAGKFNVGVSTRSNSAVSWLAADLDPGASYFIVGAYDIITGTANDVARIWLNTSAIGGAEPAADATSVPGTDLGTAGIERFFLRQDNATNTPFIEMDELRIGTTWNSVTPGGAVPTLSASALTAFGNVCINTTAGPNTFTISGSNLTTANVTVAALTGYEYATASGGPYTSSLSISQPGGTFSQQVFVRFNPTAVQTYNGNIPVNGGGVTTPVNVAAVGAGVNTAPSVTTGAASAITLNSATAAGSIPVTGCTAITAYGIEYSTILGFTPGTGTQVASSNLSGGNFSSNLTGLSAGTIYYYRAYATNGGGTVYGSELSFSTLTPNPAILTTTLTAFGNVCINTTAGPNSFTINGSNLTNANVLVGPLTGYTFSTTSGGTYSTSLNLTQAGGTYTQQIFVRFTPTAVQSYNGNIPVSGGGVASTVNVAASGAGVNTTATVTTGAASAITQTTATAAGSITAIGCSNVTVYGIEYSTTNNFPLGTGTQVTSSNLSGGNFSANLTGLTASTTYYYRAYATNAGGTAYGNQLSFSTVAPTMTVTALTPFGNVCINTTSAANSFTITGVGLSNANVNVGPLAGYTFSTSSGGTYTASLSLAQAGGAYSQSIFVRFTPTAVQSYAGNIPVNGGGATSTSVAVDGNGVNTLATVVTGGSANITNHSATLAGSIPATGCSNVTAYGIEYSGINGFGNATGTKVPSVNLSSGSFTAALTGLVQGATYYYKAYAVNNGGTSYGLQQSFTVATIADGFAIYPAPAQRGTSIRITKNDLKPGYYGLLFLNSAGQLVYQHNINVQADFINQSITLPGSIMSGAYWVILVNNDDIISTKTIHIF
jgi:hypothetical protein